MSLTCEETVKLIRSYGSLLSLTVVTVQKPFNSDSSADTEICTRSKPSCACGFVVVLIQSSLSTVICLKHT